MWLNFFFFFQVEDDNSREAPEQSEEKEQLEQPQQEQPEKPELAEQSGQSEQPREDAIVSITRTGAACRIEVGNKDAAIKQ